MTTRISVFGLAAVVFLLCAAGWPAAAEVNQESGGVEAVGEGDQSGGPFEKDAALVRGPAIRPL